MSEHTVRASARVGVVVLADIWRLQLQVQARDNQQDQAFRRRQRAVDTVRRVLDGTGVHSFDEVLRDDLHHDGAVVATWSISVSGGITEQTVVREITARLAAEPDVLISGPEWELAVASRRQARLRALGEAAEKAREDAEAMVTVLRRRLGQLIRVESGDGSRNSPMMLRTAVAAGAGEMPGRTLELELEPPEIDIDAEATVTYEVV
ncbi:SIMPL domain-containing protein [Corynebacterium pacaense]|uniref:SIMPL domain-containing protein n=1 Tax=Corynebacterium pacaense TaxID=1816684 RepID=UPI0009BA2418|nr:SIMPL domain-containing protein [Corynebacterium pacaense]